MHRHRKKQVELVFIDTKSNDAVARIFEQTWLACYPRPMRIIHDYGWKFTRYAFIYLLCILNIKDVHTTSKILNLMQYVRGCIIWSLFKDLNFIVTSTNTTRCPPSHWWWTIDHHAFHEIYHLNYLKASLDYLAFSWDMLLNVHFITKWQIISLNREALVNNAFIKTNQKRINNDYYVGQCVLKYDQTNKENLLLKPPALMR